MLALAVLDPGSKVGRFLQNRRRTGQSSEQRKASRLQQSTALAVRSDNAPTFRPEIADSAPLPLASSLSPTQADTA